MAIKAFKKGYPYVNALYQLSILVHYIGYLYNKTPFYSPWLRLIGIEVKRMSAADYVCIHSDIHFGIHSWWYLKWYVCFKEIDP